LASLSEAVTSSHSSNDFGSNEFELGVLNAGPLIQFISEDKHQKGPRSTYLNKPIQFLGRILMMNRTINP